MVGVGMSEVVARPLAGKKITRSIGLTWRKSAGRGEAYRQIAEIIRSVAARKFKDLVID